LKDVRGSGGGQVVETIPSVEDQRSLMPEVLQHAHHQSRQRRRADAERLPAHPSRVGERAEDIEHGPDAKLTPGRPACRIAG